MLTVSFTAFVESPGGIPPGAPRAVQEPLESHGSRYSAVAGTPLPRPPAPPVSSWPLAKAEQRSPLLQPHYRAFNATTGCSAPAPRFGTLTLAVGAACGLSLHVVGRDEAQVLTFHTKAWSSFAPPTCRVPLGQYQGIRRADPGGRVTPRF